MLVAYNETAKSETMKSVQFKHYVYYLNTYWHIKTLYLDYILFSFIYQNIVLIVPIIQKK